jgi:hypothetical protein
MKGVNAMSNIYIRETKRTMRQLPNRPPRRLTAICLPPATALTILALTTGMWPALAGDSKIYPGSACQAWNAGTSAYASSSIVATGSGSVMNASSITSHEVSCPVVRDTTLNTNGTFANVLVYGYNTGASGFKVTCTFNVTNANTGTSFSTSTQSSSAAAGNFELSIPVTKSVSGGYYDIQCFLPPGSKIYGYNVPEHSP